MHVSISDVPCRLAGTAGPVPETGRKLTRRTLSEEMARLALTRATETAAAPPLRDGHGQLSGRLPSYRERSGFTPTADATGAFFWNAPRDAAHRLRVRNAASCVSTLCGDSLASAVLPNGLAASQASRTLGASDRLLLSHVFVRVPAPRWFPSVSWRSRAPRYGESPDSRQSGSLRWAPPA
jgi:hypothetical protein